MNIYPHENVCCLYYVLGILVLVNGQTFSYSLAIWITDLFFKWSNAKVNGGGCILLVIFKNTFLGEHIIYDYSKNKFKN